MEFERVNELKKIEEREKERQEGKFYFIFISNNLY
jgi:hypothetical protein